MVRKGVFLLLILQLFTFYGNAQHKDEIRAYYGIAESGLITFAQLEGTASYNVESFQEFGLRYLYHTRGNLYLAGGINYLRASIATTPAPSSQPTLEIDTDPLNIISVPLFLHLQFGRYFFINGGPSLDFQLTDNTYDRQSGIGLTLGLGAHYSIENFTLFVNPNVKSHAMLPFAADNYHQRLLEIGVQLGLGYQF